jgi:hypothetical protein
MNHITYRFRNALLFTAFAAIPFVMSPGIAVAEEAHYHDAAHNDDHVWGKNEDQAYRIWVKQNHRKNVEFAKLRAEDQASYWAWRHDHSDAVLKINIR